jgi:hypothetical protein
VPLQVVVAGEVHAPVVHVWCGWKIFPTQNEAAPHKVPLTLLTKGMHPDAMLHPPPVWHSLGAGQERPGPLQTPAVQVSGFVQLLPSLQEGPVCATGAGQPLAGMHAPWLKHCGGVAQVTADPPPQLPAPAWQVVPVVHAFPSSQGRPTLTVCAGHPLGCTQAPTE